MINILLKIIKFQNQACIYTCIYQAFVSHVKENEEIQNKKAYLKKIQLNYFKRYMLIPFASTSGR